jgi:hypothetical protein
LEPWRRCSLERRCFGLWIRDPGVFRGVGVAVAGSRVCGVVLGPSGPLAPRRRGSQETCRVRASSAFGRETSRGRDAPSSGLEGFETPGQRCQRSSERRQRRLGFLGAEGRGADGPRFELRVTRSLEFEYAEALRAGGAEDSSGPGADGPGRSVRMLFGAFAWAVSGRAESGFLGCDAPKVHQARGAGGSSRCFGTEAFWSRGARGS